MNAQAVKEEYRSALQRYTRESVCRRHFVLVDKLQDWLRRVVEPNVTNAARLLHVAFIPRDSPGSPINLEYFQPGDNCCLLIFCILLEIGCAEALPDFLRRGKVDKLIPLRRATVQDTFQAAGINNTDMHNRFFELQYRFCPTKFDLYLGTHWEEKVVVPICEKNAITQGGTAELWQIAVPEDFVGHKLREISFGSKFNAGTEKEPDWVRFPFAHPRRKHQS